MSDSTWKSVHVPHLATQKFESPAPINVRAAEWWIAVCSGALGKALTALN